MEGLSDEQRVAEYKKWCEERPPAIRVVAEKFSPLKSYKIVATGQACDLYSFYETDDGVRLKVVAYNFIPPHHLVFGYKPEDIVEWETEH